MYNTRALYVDGDKKSIVARRCRGNGNIGEDDDDINIPYDVVLGCDGVRSVVRNAFLTKHRDFEFDLKGTFGYAKAVHVPCPSNVHPATFMFINDALPGGWGSFILPETGNKLNVAVGTDLNKQCPPELQSKDPQVVAKYFKQHWHAFEIDSDEVGKQWVSQSWNTIPQAHCNFYHSTKLRALLLGDAAHATVPNIGQGMNTALADAEALNKLLDEYDDDWNAVLPKFSQERVKEGNALTDLSFHTFSLNGGQQLNMMVRRQIRTTLNKYFPRFVDPDPMNEITKGMKLSEAYHRMNELGFIQKIRATNDRIMREHFEKTVGMVRDEKKNLLFGGGGVTGLLLVAGAAACVGAIVVCTGESIPRTGFRGVLSIMRE